MQTSRFGFGGTRFRQAAALALFACAILGWILLGARSARLPSGITPVERAVQAYDALPLHFEGNAGQTRASVAFLARGIGYTLFLAPTEAVLSLWKPSNLRDENTPLRLKFVGGNPAARIVGSDPLPGRSHYFSGSDPRRWRTEVPHFARVKYEQVYSGVDLVFYGTQGQLEYDFVVAPGADPALIKLGVQGAKSVGVDATGGLLIQTAADAVLLRKPVLYQDVNGTRNNVAGGYALDDDGVIKFQVGAYDSTKTLIIDPVLTYSTYLGGTSDDTGRGIVVDASGNIYVTSFSFSADFPVTQGAFQTASAGAYDVAVTKIDPAGSQIIYSTYLGGGGDDFDSYALAVDSTGHVYVSGRTASTNFPVTPGAFQSTLKGVNNAFVTKLDPAGSSLLYSTYFGGSGDDMGRGIAVDASGNAYIAGRTTSADFPTTVGAFQGVIGGLTDVFVTKVDSTGSLVYSTFLGGGADDFVYTIAVDAGGNAYVNGYTASTNFPVTPGAFQTALAGLDDAFVFKLNPSGSALVYSTYIGGAGEDQGLNGTIDAAGNAYVTGQTFSGDFPTTAGALQTALRGSSDVFVTKLNATGSALVYSTYLGGGGDELTRGMAVDALGQAYLTGQTTSIDFPTTAGAMQSVRAGPTDSFVAKIDASGSVLAFSTYLGGSGDELGRDIAVDAFGGMYVTGVTSSADFPTTPNALQTAFGGFNDSFLVRISDLPGDVVLTADGSAVGAMGGGGCFIATAAYGSSMAAEIQILRAFRDRVLLQSRPGRLLVAAYYRLSPPVADFIRPHEGLRAATRGLLLPTIWWASLALVSPGFALALGGACMLGCALFPAVLLRARHRSREKRIARTV